MTKPAYAIVRIDVHDPDAYGKYIKLAGPSVAKYGGEFLVRGGETIVMEGEARSRNVLLQFPDMEAAKSFYHSPEYQEALAFALPASTRDYILVEGL